LNVPPFITSFMRGSVDAIAVVDQDLRLLGWNRQYARLAGLSERDLRRRQHVGMCHEHFHLDSCEVGGCVAQRAVRLGRSIRVDEVRARDSELRLIVTAVPLGRANGDVTGKTESVAVVETYRDVSAESRMQARYKELLKLERARSEALEDQVRMRTSELESTIAQLKQTRVQLVQSEKMSSLGRLVAGVAHELNNPINFIVGNLHFLNEYVGNLLAAIDVVRQLELTPAQTTVFQSASERLRIPFIQKDLATLLPAMKGGVDRVIQVVQGLRTFSHSGTGKRAFADVNREIESVLAMLDQRARGRCTLSLKAGDLPPMYCNVGQIGQVVANLVVNAIDAIDEHGMVTVRTKAYDAMIEIVVEDNGCGIAPEIVDKVFEPFFTTKEVGQGTGLGLAISYGIVQAHGGTLEVESALGRGSAFRITLPVDGP
jgi:signal transduction histidine kinase